jgi:hypothetical protein
MREETCGVLAMKWNDESFVDFYDLLDVWPDAEVGAIRRRIADLYTEARANLEHQSHRKRFYYRELYEMQLPQARLILLDAERRIEYDGELQQYWKRKGKPPAPSKPKDSSRPKLNDLPGTAPEKAADDFSDFADIGDDALPPLNLPNLAMDRETVERRRDSKRRELIKHELVVTGLRWALLGGAGAFLPGAALAFVFYLALAPKTMLFHIIAFAFVMAVAVLIGRQSMRWAKRRIVGVLSQMSYDELLRHCGSQ